MRPFIATVTCLFALACGGEVVAPQVDETPPTSRALLSVPSGATFEVTEDFVASTRDVTIRLVSDEVGSQIYYTLDDRPPIVGERGTGVALTPAIITVTRDVIVRWFAIDQSGNREISEHRVGITFDRDAPEFEVVPGGGIYSGPIEVTVSAGVEATLYWTENDNRLPLPGQSYTKSAPRKTWPICRRASCVPGSAELMKCMFRSMARWRDEVPSAKSSFDMSPLMGSCAPCGPV